MPSAFLSYSRDDGSFAAELEKRLQSAGWSVWRDVHSLRAGDRWPRKLGEAVTASEVFVLIWSAHAARSDFVELEWTIAVAAKRQICIVWLDGQPLPATLTPYQARQTSHPDSAVQWLTGSFAAQDIPVGAAEPVLRKLDAAPAAEPPQLTAALRAAFIQPGWSVGGSVYQAGGDVNVYIGEPNKAAGKGNGRKAAYIVAPTLVVLVVAVICYKWAVGPSPVSESAPGSVATNRKPQPFGGWVQDEQGRPLEGVKVTAPRFGVSAVTDRDGRFSLPLPMAADTNFRLVLEKLGYEVRTADPPAGDTSFNCVLRKNASGKAQ
jgi:hypothetical protein